MFGWADSGSWRFSQVFGFGCILLFLSHVLPSQAVGQTSATVRKISNTDPMISQEEAWRIGDSPLFEVGALGNPDSLDFYGVRDLLRLSDGTTVVANSGELELIFLSPTGSVIATSGRRGEGPGEFLHLGKIGRFRGDSVFAMDYARAALSFFDKEGTFGRAIQIHSVVPRGYWPAGALPDGRFLFFSDAFMIGGGAFPQDSTWAFILDLETEVADTIGRFPKSDAGNPPGSMALGPTSIMAVGAEHFYWGRGDDFEFHQFDSEGKLVRLISKGWEPFRVSERSWQRYGEARLESLRKSRTSDIEDLIRRARQEHERIDHAEFLPAFFSAVVDSEGNLWVEEYPLRGVRSVPWHVFSPAGRWLTSLEMPDGFRLKAAGSDWVLGITTDELDVEIVQLLPLVK
ncbi:MAG: hypothetical protein HKO65_14155 [Gemmatimonadetes bacterium]|nr:hypothetical protein [Gemmatimonadota bacterium]NNM06229.1 hypothetical protein [Gemmatimonadota bacterium]